MATPTVRPRTKYRVQSSATGPQLQNTAPGPQPQNTAPDPQPQNTGHGPQPQNTGPDPQPQNTAPDPQPQSSATGPQPQNTAPDPQPQNTAPDPQPQNTGHGPQPQNTGHGPQPQNTGTDPQPQSSATGPQPQNTAPDPQPQNTGPDPQPQNTGPDPQPQNTGPDPQPQNTGPDPQPQNTGPDPQPQNTAPDPQSQNTGPDHQPPSPATALTETSLEVSILYHPPLGRTSIQPVPRDPPAAAGSHDPSPAVTILQSVYQNVPEELQIPSPGPHPPPRPKIVPSFKNSSSARDGDSVQLNDVKSSDACGEKVPSPLPPLRPEHRPPLHWSCSVPSQLLYERVLPQAERGPQMRPLRPAHPPPGPHRAEALDSAYDDLRVTCGKPANARRNSPPVRPGHPPPPLFKPPPAPSTLPLLCPPAPGLTCHTESVYSEVEDPLYLEVLPAETDLQTPSTGLYRSTAGLRTPSSQSRPSSSNRGVSAVCENTEDFESLLRWLRTVGNRETKRLSLCGVNKEQEIRDVNQTALQVKKAFRLFNYLLIKRSDTLRRHIAHLNHQADCLGKVQKKAQTLSIAGGTAGALGGVAAIVGIALAPVTMGASLVATAMGAGMVVSAGGMSAKAAAASRKVGQVERARLEEVVELYKDLVTDMEICLDVLLTGVDDLRRRDVSCVQGAEPEAVRLATLAQAQTLSSTHASVSSDTLFHVFRKDMDECFEGKPRQKLRRGSEGKFSSQLYLLALGLEERLDEMYRVWERFTFLAGE